MNRFRQPAFSLVLEIKIIAEERALTKKMILKVTIVESSDLLVSNEYFQLNYFVCYNRTAPVIF